MTVTAAGKGLDETSDAAVADTAMTVSAFGKGHDETAAAAAAAIETDNLVYHCIYNYMASQGDKFASDTCTPTPVASNTPTYSTPQGSSEGVHDSNEPPPTNFTTHDESNLDDTFEDGQNVGGKRKRSAVWNHFKLMKVNGEDKAECNYCKKKLGGSSKNGTSHLRDHFERCPRRTVKDIRQSILIMEQKKVDGSSSYLSNYTFNPDNSRRDLAEMIIVHEYPLTTVDHHGFRKFVQGLQPLFKVPSRNTIKSDILKIYEYERVKTKKLLGRITSRVAITTDMWTANHQRKGFMAVTAHFIDDSWNLQSRIMRFIYVPAPHTADVLADTLYDCLCDWNIDRKVSTLTVDNCTTNDAIINKLLQKLPLRSLMRKGELFHMRCCAHILNLIVQDGLSVIEDGIERIRDSVLFWSASGKREQKFEEAANQLEMEYTKKLIVDCKTRWNSTYLMLSVAIPYRHVFTRLKQREPRYTSLPTDLDWDLATEICNKLQLFYRVTLLFSGNKYPTANVFFPLICEIRFSMREWTKSSIVDISLMAYKMSSKFDKYWSVIHGIMGMAAVLDPRYKLKYVELLMPALYGEEMAKEEFKSLEDFVRAFFKEYESTNSRGKNYYEGGGSSSSLFSSGLSECSSGGFQKFLSDIKSKAKVNDDLNDMAELDNYLKENLLPDEVELDLLLWWKTNGGKYPTLQRMAKDVLAIPVSTVASESAFSTSGRLISPHRSRLHPKTLEALMCAQSWLLNEIRETCSEETEAYCRTIEYEMDVEEVGTKESGTTTLDDLV
ncbi:zinc finger BED domain-containing protein RICESLEEPER 2-like [Bidens hawaiensis]|uniref:zinc finger BED domain-containing protein RICESLEEPER 2-like n=2 Tax=Bidens hawaiensis TaxID=980011 RepID=UPI00404AFFEE